MAVLSRRAFGSVELLRVDSNPNGTSAPTGSLATLTTNGAVYKNIGGTSWQLVTSFTPLSNNGAGGATGGSGARGAQGVQGSTGHQGFTGHVGHQGHQGNSGDKGSQGHPGTPGSQGPAGSQGSQGTQGHTGHAGAVGIQGGAGPQGSAGSQGAQGTNAGAGAQGNVGPQGTQGFQGAQGSAGPQGAQGSSTSGTNYLVLVSSQYVNSNTSAVTFSSLSGDADKVYVIKGRLIIGGSVSSTTYNYSIKPGNIASTQYRLYRISSSAGSSTQFAPATFWGRPGSEFSFTAEYFVEKSKQRTAEGRFSGFDVAMNGPITGDFFWVQGTDGTTNLTSLTITADSTPNNWIAAGSEFHLYKYVTA